MASNIKLKVSHRGSKQRVKRLPASIEVPSDATIENVKQVVAKQAGVGDYNRIGVFNPATRKNIKDRKALVRDEPDIVAKGEVLVQDLGLQMGWRQVYVIEYLGPILFHLFFLWVRPYLAKVDPFFYKGADKTPVTTIQWLIFALFQLHFLKREIETIFIHRFSANTMPAWNIFRNSAFYWLMSGLLCGFFIYSPKSFAARDDFTPLDLAGLVLFFYGEICNLIVHLHLATLRKPGDTNKGIPNCIGSSLVTCPNYMFEVIAWIGVILISREWSVIAFICTGGIYMKNWSRQKERALRLTFGDKYKKHKYTMLPGLI